MLDIANSFLASPLMHQLNLNDPTEREKAPISARVTPLATGIQINKI
jgi:hypothetical protein